MALGGSAAVRTRSMPAFGSKFRERQLDTLTQLVNKRIEDESLRDIASKNDFSLTSTERGISKWEHGHLISALDTLNSYQKERRAKSRMHIVGHRMGLSKTYKDDPRTRCVELLKRWLRQNAASKEITEVEVQRIRGLCRDIIHHPMLFPARNERSFMTTIAEVKQHLDVQLLEVLERTRTCADAAKLVLSLSRNLVSDAIGYLLVGLTDLKKTDELPSLEIVSLWAALPSDSHPLPGRIDEKMQRNMKDVWLTSCGKLIANLLRTQWCVSLFEGAGAREEAAATPRHASTFDMAALIDEMKAEFDGKSLKNSGLAMCFRKAGAHSARMDYLWAVQVLVDLIYLIGEALVQFHRISDGLGDYGMIQVADWLHPFLEALTGKIVRLKGHMESLHNAVDKNIIEAFAKGYAVEKPAPSQKMRQRASLAIERSIVHSDCHIQALLQAVEELKQRSSPERLPEVKKRIGDACFQLDNVLSSPEFRACVGDNFPDLPRIADVALSEPRNQIEGTMGSSPLAIQGITSRRIDVCSPLTIQDITGIEGTGTPRAMPNLRMAATEHSKNAPEVHPLEPNTPILLGSFKDSGISKGARTPQNSSNPFEDEGTRTPQDSSNPFEDDVHQVPQGSSKVGAQWGTSQHRDDALPLSANVFRLSSSHCGPGFRRHDRRSLRLQGGKFHIYQKGSTMKVKTSLDVQCDVESCSILPGSKRLSLVIRRLPPGADIQSGVWNPKCYDFEFDSANEAVAFHNEIARLLE